MNHNVNVQYVYNVYLDIKDTLSAYKVNKLKTILNVKYGVFRNVQNIQSKESVILQMADFILGAISYNRNNTEKSNEAKNAIIERIKKHTNIDLDKTNHNDKLNLFFIDLK